MKKAEGAQCWWNGLVFIITIEGGFYPRMDQDNHDTVRSLSPVNKGFVFIALSCELEQRQVYDSVGAKNTLLTQRSQWMGPFNFSTCVKELHLADLLPFLSAEVFLGWVYLTSWGFPVLRSKEHGSLRVLEIYHAAWFKGINKLDDN